MTDKPLLEVELKQRRIAFNSFDEIDAWLKRERDEQSWMHSNIDAGPEFNQLRDNFRSQLNNARSALADWRNGGDAKQAEALRNQLVRIFREKRIVLSDDPIAVIAKSVGDKAGQVASVGAYAVLVGIQCAVNFQTMHGMLLAIMIRDGITPDSRSVVVEVLQALQTKGEEETKQRREDWHSLSSQASADLIEQRTSAAAVITDTGKRTDDLLGKVHLEAAQAVESIKVTEASYREQMQLQAPVEYWEQKAASHKGAIKLSRRNIILFTIFGGGILLIALFALALLAGNSAGEKTGGDAAAIYLKFAAVGAIATTIIFWTGRVLLRIYLSDRHLLTDAEERIAMIKTYLALSNEKKVEAAERALVLAPIFRSAADGIVKDDGADATLAGIIAKAIDIRGKS